MELISVKIPSDLRQKLDATTKARKASKSAIVREALEAYFKQEQPQAGGGCLDQIGDLVGRFEGPEDLATNKKYMKGFGR